MNSVLLNEQKILETEKQLLEAMKASDVGMLDRLLHEDLLFILPTGEVITKALDLETHKSGNLVIEEMTSTIDSVKIIEENIVVALTSKLKGKMSEQNFEGNFRYIRVWKLFDDQLKVIAGSCVAM